MYFTCQYLYFYRIISSVKNMFTLHKYTQLHWSKCTFATYCWLFLQSLLDGILLWHIGYLYLISGYVRPKKKTEKLLSTLYMRIHSSRMNSAPVAEIISFGKTRVIKFVRHCCNVNKPFGCRFTHRKMTSQCHKCNTLSPQGLRQTNG